MYTQPDGPVTSEMNKMIQVRYSTILCTGRSKVGKTKFCHALMNQDTPPSGKGDFHKVFVKKKAESIWAECDIAQLGVLIDQANKLHCTKESNCTTPADVIDGDEVLDILILLDINVPTSTICLLPQALVTFVTYKLCGKEDYVCHVTCNFIKELMSSYCFEDKPTFTEYEIKNDIEKEFYTAFIGTFFNDDSSSETIYNKEASTVDEKLQKLESCINCSLNGMPLSFWFLETESYLHVVNLINTPDKIFKDLRDRLEETVTQNSVYQIPLTWVLLSLKIQKLCSEHEPKLAFLKYEIIEKIWIDECGMHKEDELKLALQFFHHRGVLLHFDAIEGVKDYVFVHCCWIFDQLKYLLTDLKYKGRNHNAKELFMKEGVLSSKMIKEIEFDGPEKITLQAFLKLLSHLKFIAEIKLNEYFMPSILESYECDENIFSRYGSKSYDSLLITFTSGSMHRSVFCFLATSLMKKLPEGWLKLAYDKPRRQQHTFKDLIIFSIKTGYYVYIIDKVFSLEVSIYSKSSPCDDLHMSVYKIIENTLKDVCKSVEIPYEECRYGFLCNTCGSSDHMMVILTDCVAHCSKNNDSLHLSRSQTVWLKVSYLFFCS